MSFKKRAAVSLGGRYIWGKQTRKFETETTIAGLPGPLAPLNGFNVVLDSEATSSGFGAVISVNLAPLPGLNIGAHYETVTKLEWEYTKAEGPIAVMQGIAEGNTFNRDLPAMLAIGASYKVFPRLKVEGSFDYYFQKSANWDGVVKPFYFGDDASSSFPPTVTVGVDKSLWIIALGLECKIF